MRLIQYFIYMVKFVVELRKYMKKLLVLITACTICSSIFAQDNMGKMKMSHSHKKKSMHSSSMKDCVMMEDGKMMVTKHGKDMMMDKDMTMTNGTMVMTDGTVKMKDGKTMMMKDGDHIYMNGKMGKMKMDKSGKMKM